MKKISKKFLSIVLALILVLCAIPATGMAAKTPHMKDVNVKWDLKKNSSVTVVTKYASIDVLQKVKVTMSNYKKTTKKGKTTVSFMLTYTPQFKPTKEQVDRMYRMDWMPQDETGFYGGRTGFSVVDYQTGKTLKADNDKGVTVKVGKWSYGADVVYEGLTGTKVTWPKWSKVKVTITYPKNYTGLCFGVHGCTEESMDSDANIAFENGKKKFGATTYYSKSNKKVAHFMRMK